MSIPNQIGVNPAVKYINGLELSKTAAKKISIAAGACSNSTNVNDIILSDAVTINGALVGANGVDIAVIILSSFYAVYVIGDSNSFNHPAGLLSLNTTAPTLPFGYDMFRRVGFVLTDGSANILQFWQTGHGSDRVMHYDTPIATPAITTSANTYANQSLAAGIPPIACETILKVTFTAETLTDIATFAPYGSSASNGMVVWGTGVAGVQQFMVNVPCVLNSGVPTIAFKTTADTPEAEAIFVSGYVDSLT